MTREESDDEIDDEMANDSDSDQDQNDQISSEDQERISTYLMEFKAEYNQFGVKISNDEEFIQDIVEKFEYIEDLIDENSRYLNQNATKADLEMTYPWYHSFCNCRNKLFLAYLYQNLRSPDFKFNDLVEIIRDSEEIPLQTFQIINF